MDEYGIEDICHQLSRVAKAISADACRNTDEAGVSVDSLTEAVMGVTAGLCRIAKAIDGLAEAVRESPR